MHAHGSIWPSVRWVMKMQLDRAENECRDAPQEPLSGVHYFREYDVRFRKDISRDRLNLKMHVQVKVMVRNEVCYVYGATRPATIPAFLPIPVTRLFGPSDRNFHETSTS